MLWQAQQERMLMKKYAVLLSVLAALSAYAADPPKTTDKTTDNKALQTSSAQAQAKTQHSLTQEAKPNEIVKDKVAYSGIAVELVKTDNPLQLINPAAPAKYGSPEDNTLRNPIDGKVIGLKIFSIRF
jgi:hypothetical protein